jgi:hypothetical protein
MNEQAKNKLRDLIEQQQEAVDRLRRTLPEDMEPLVTARWRLKEMQELLDPPIEPPSKMFIPKRPNSVMDEIHCGLEILRRGHDPNIIPEGYSQLFWELVVLIYNN